MDIFSTENYKEFVRSHIKSLPNRGRGQLRKMALYLEIHPVIITQVFNGDRDLTLEQAAKLTKFLMLSTFEAEYFISLVELARAGNQELRNIVHARIGKLRQSSQNMATRVPKNISLSEEAKAIFYSAWYYSGSRLASGLEQNRDIDDVAKCIGMDRSKVAKAVEFLLENKLCVIKNGQISEGPQFTFLSGDSPYIAKHHTNWRVKGIQTLDRQKKDDELFYTFPMSLSTELAKKIRAQLVEVIQGVTKQIKNSELETLYCLNIDWFNFGGE